MKNLKRNILIWCLALNCGLSTAGRSEPTEDLLKACDEALYACKVSSDSDLKLIATQEELINAQINRISELESRDSGIIHQNWFWMLVGAGVTGAAIAITK